MASVEADVIVRASRALSMPVALIAGLVVEGTAVSESREERSRVPRVFFCADLALPVFADLREASSSARSAAFSAFFRAASAALAAAASL
jgi:hypothetical protein